MKKNVLAYFLQKVVFYIFFRFGGQSTLMCNRFNMGPFVPFYNLFLKKKKTIVFPA